MGPAFFAVPAAASPTASPTAAAETGKIEKEYGVWGYDDPTTLAVEAGASVYWGTIEAENGGAVFFLTP